MRGIIVHNYLLAVGLLLVQPLHAEDALSGAAAIIGAAAPIAVAGIQAGADKAIAKLNAAAELKKTEINADVARDTNRTNATIELDRTKTAAEINAINQEGLTDRQAIVSTEKIIATREAYATQREKNWRDYEYSIARLLSDDKAREQQLALEKQARDLQTSIGMLASTGSNGGLTINRVEAVADPSATNSLAAADTSTTATALASAGTPEPQRANTVQSRLTRTLAATIPSMAEKLTGFRASKRTSSVASLPQLVATAARVEKNNPLVRGSRSTKLLPIALVAEETQIKTLGKVATSQRAAYSTGIGHGTIGRQNQAPLFASGDGGSESSHGHHQH